MREATARPETAGLLLRRRCCDVSTPSLMHDSEPTQHYQQLLKDITWHYMPNMNTDCAITEVLKKKKTASSEDF